MTAGTERRGGTAAAGGDATPDEHRGGEDGSGNQGSAAGVLADRMAAALVHREPGWKLPRRSALARRFNVSLAEIDVAVEELSRRSLLRKLPDGQLYRASPAEYQIPIEGLAGLSTTVDPMGSAIVCQAKHVSRRPAPQDIRWALGLTPGAQVQVVRCLWTSGGSPVAMSTAYLPQSASPRQPAAPRVTAPQDADSESGWLPAFEEVLSAPPAEAAERAAPADLAERAGPPGPAEAAEAAERAAPADLAERAGPPGPAEAAGSAGPSSPSEPAGSAEAAGTGPADADSLVTAGRPAALNVELSPPQPSIARGLHLAPGQPAITVTIRFDQSSVPVALTVVMLRPDFFKVSVETASPPAS